MVRTLNSTGYSRQHPSSSAHWAALMTKTDSSPPPPLRPSHSAIASCVTFLFLPHFDFICDLLVNRRMAIWNQYLLNVFNIPTLYDRGDAIGNSMFEEISSKNNHKLHPLLPPLYLGTLRTRKNRKFQVPRFKTNRLETVLL